MPDIFEYLDYRKYLSDCFVELKSKKRFFTYRYIAGKLGIKSPGHVTWILQGKRNLSSKTIDPMCDLLKLNKKQADFFKALVYFNQSNTHLDKKFYLDKLVYFKKKENKSIPVQHYEFYEKWYNSVIREMVNVFKIKDNYAALAQKLKPNITPKEAEQSIALLHKLGFIKKNQRGYYEQAYPTVTTGEEWKSVAINHFQMDVIDLAKNSINEVSKDERDISTLTMSLSSDRIELIKKKIKEFRQEIIMLVREGDDPEQVYELNFSLFPLSVRKGDKK